MAAMRPQHQLLRWRLALVLGLLIFTEYPLRGQDQYNPKPASVRAGQGTIEFRKLVISEAYGVLLLDGEIANQTGTDWPEVEFGLLLKGFQYKTVLQRDPNCQRCVSKIRVLVADKSKPVQCNLEFLPYQGIKGERQEFGINIRPGKCSVLNQCKFEPLPFGERRYIQDGKCSTPDSVFELSALDVTLVRAVSREDALKAQREKTAAEDAARRRVLQKEEEERKAQFAKEEASRAAARAAEEARQRELAQLPKLENGNETIPIAADEKCLSQTVDAINEGGLESRKKLSELLAYRCLFTVKSETPVRILKKGWRSSLVSVADGEHEGQSGWVSSDWLRQ